MCLQRRAEPRQRHSTTLPIQLVGDCQGGPNEWLVGALPRNDWNHQGAAFARRRHLGFAMHVDSPGGTQGRRSCGRSGDPLCPRCRRPSRNPPSFCNHYANPWAYISTLYSISLYQFNNSLSSTTIPTVQCGRFVSHSPRGVRLDCKEPRKLESDTLRV